MFNPKSLEILAMKAVDKHNLDAQFSEQNMVSPKLFEQMRTKYKKCCLGDGSMDEYLEEAARNGHLSCLKEITFSEVPSQQVFMSCTDLECLRYLRDVGVFFLIYKSDQTYRLSESDVHAAQRIVEILDSYEKVVRIDPKIRGDCQQREQR